MIRKLAKGPLSPIFSVVWRAAVQCQLAALKFKWLLTVKAKPDARQQALVRENVTFIFKSFERQGMARRLYRSIQAYYPGVRVIIADDSREPLDLEGPGLTVIRLPFNSGLSRGLNQALERVSTPYVVRMDDDELLTPGSDFHGHLDFLMAHPEADLVAVQLCDLPLRRNWQDGELQRYMRSGIAGAPKLLRIPHGTWIDGDHVVLGKTPNTFIARTEPYRALGYDDCIRMIDHQEFFWRAAGNLVSVLDRRAYVFHCHNIFDRNYRRYRSDVEGDRAYIRRKHFGEPQQKENQE